ncbi:hypothetical protein AAC387_Pa10g1228 [Persea americana]
MVYLYSPFCSSNVYLKKFPNLFPHLHWNIQFEEQYHDIGNTEFINNPGSSLEDAGILLANVMILFFESELPMQMRKEIRELFEVHIEIAGRRMEIITMKKLMQYPRQLQFEEEYIDIENIVFINNPVTSLEDAMWFKKLTRLEFLFLDAYAALSYCRICGFADSMTAEANKELTGSSSQRLCKRQVNHQMKMGNLGLVLPLWYVAPSSKCSLSDNSEVQSSITPLPTDADNETDVGHGM